MTDIPSEPVQPPTQEGQGAAASDNGLYPDLSAVPESIQAQVLPLLKEFEGNVTRKFQEAADFRKQWEPYQQLGLQDIQMDDLKELLEFRQIASDPEAFRDWYKAVGQELAFDEQAPQQEPTPGDGLTPDSLKELLNEALDQRLGPIEQAYQQQEQSRALQEAESFVTSKLDELQTQHGEFDRDAVCQLALAYDQEADAIERGFADYQRLIGAAEKNYAEGKLAAPDTPEQGGRPNGTPPEVRTFADAKKAAMAMVQQAMQQ